MVLLETFGIAIKAAVLKSLPAAVGKWSYSELSKNFTFFKILSDLKIERPKDEMGRLYLHSVILFTAKGKPREFIELLLSAGAQASFKREKRYEESGAFLLELDHALHTSQHIREIKHWNEIPFEQIEEFFKIYDDLVTSVQTPVQAKLVAGNNRIENKVDQTKDSVDALTQVVKELSAKVTGQVAPAESEKDNHDAINLEYQRQLKVISAHLNNGQVKRALDELQTLKAEIWDRSNNAIKFKILTNIGVCYFRQNQQENAYNYLLEAYAYDQGSNLALSNVVNACMALDNDTEANKYLDILLSLHPLSVEGHVCLIKLRIDTLPIEEVEKLIPDSLKTNPETVAALGVANREAGNLDQAIRLLENAYLARPEDEYLEQHLMQVYLEKYEKNFRLINIKELGADAKKELEHVLALIERHYQRVEKTDLAELKSKVLLSKSFILDCLKRRDEALVAVEQALVFDPEHPALLKQKGLQLAFSGELDKAVVLLKQISDTALVPDVPLFIAEVLRNDKKYEEAILVLEQYMDQEPDDYYIQQGKHILLDLYIRANHKEKIQVYIERYSSDNGLQNLTSLANANNALGNKDQAIVQLEQAYAQLNKDSTFKEQYFLGEALLDNQMYAQAVLVYEAITDLDVHSELTVTLIQLYQRMGRINDGLKLMDRLRTHNGPLRGITEAEIGIYQDLGDYQKSRDVAIEYVEKFPSNLSMRLRLNSLELRLENFDVADRFLEGEIEYWNLDITNFRNYVAQLLSRNKRKEVFKAVYEYRRLKNNQEAHIAYLQTVLQYPLTSDEIGEPVEVAIDCAVVLKNKSGQEYVQIIENRASTDLLENEINPEHPRFKVLIGKKVGDVVQFNSSSQKWTVSYIMGKLKYAFQQSQIKSDTIYAETSPIKTFHADDFWEVIGKLGNPNWQKNLDKMSNYYISGQLPFGAFASQIDKSPFEMWDFIRSLKKVGVRSSTGQLNEIVEFSSFLNADKILVMDILCLITVHKLEIFHLLRESFSKLLITPSTYDHILDFCQDVKMFKLEDVIDENAEHLLTEVRKYVQVVLPINIIEMNSLEKQKRDELLGKSFHESIILAEEKNAIFCSDDFSLRELVMQEYGLDTTWSHSLIWYLHKSGKLSYESYQDLVIRLVRLNYHHTSIGKDTLTRALGQSGNRIDDHNVPIFDVLRGEQSSIDTAVGVAFQFLVDVWLNPAIDLHQKDQITHYTLMSLATNRPINAFFAEVNKNLKLMGTTFIKNEFFKFFAICVKLQLQKILDNFDIVLTTISNKNRYIKP